MVGGGGGEHENGTWAPIGAPLNVQRDDHHHHHHHHHHQQQQQQHWSNSSSNFDSSVNAVSFGFVATAILISMFLVMAILERFLRPPSSPDLLPAVRHNRRVFQPPRTPSGKQLNHPSPKMSLYASWVSVLMPGDEIPTFIAHPAPAPCGPERISWPSHQQHKSLSCSTSNILPNTINQV